MFVQFTGKTFTCMAETKPVHAEKAEKDRVDERVDKIMPSVSSSNHYRSFKYCIYRVWHKKTIPQENWKYWCCYVCSL